MTEMSPANSSATAPISRRMGRREGIVRAGARPVPLREALDLGAVVRDDAVLLLDAVLAGAFFAVWEPAVLFRAADVDVVFFFVVPPREEAAGFFAGARPVDVFFCAICYLE